MARRMENCLLWRVCLSLESSILLHPALWSDSPTETTRLFETLILLMEQLLPGLFYVFMSLANIYFFHEVFPLFLLPQLHPSRLTTPPSATAVLNRYFYQPSQLAIKCANFQVFSPVLFLKDRDRITFIFMSSVVWRVSVHIINKMLQDYLQEKRKNVA